MAIQDDWTINYSAKTISHTSGETVYTVLQLFQWLAAEFASQSQMDDDYAFVSDTPSVYRFVNDWAFGTPATDYKYLSGGSIASSDANELWANLYSIGTQEAGTQIYVIQNDVELSSWWGTGNIDILILVKTGGTFIQSNNTSGVPTDGGLWVYAREFNDTYDHNFVDLSAGGRNPVGINTASDVSNQTAQATVSGYNDISITFGSYNYDLNNGNGLQPYDVLIDCAGRTTPQIYEYLKYVCRHDSEVELNSDGGEEYRSADEGNYTEVKTAPFGTLAGTTFYGATGVWLTNYDTADFVLKDSNGVLQSPPDYQKVTVNHTTLSGCQIFVSEISAGEIVKDKYSVASTTASTITVSGSIDINKTLQSGKLRESDTVYSYTSISGSVFEGVTPDCSGVTGPIYTPLMDRLADASQELSDNLIYTSSISVRTTVRKYGFKEYSTDTTFGATGLTFSPILTEDPQAT
jgi:hypothetical protein